MARNFRESREMMERTRLAVEKKALEKKANLAKKRESSSQVVQDESVVDNLENDPEVPTEEVSNDVEDSPMDSFEERLNRLGLISSGECMTMNSNLPNFHTFDPIVRDPLDVIPAVLSSMGGDHGELKRESIFN